MVRDNPAGDGKTAKLFPVEESLVSDNPAGDGKTAKLFPVEESLVSDNPAGDGKTANLFLQCRVKNPKQCHQNLFDRQWDGNGCYITLQYTLVDPMALF